jgi:erythromycin esterase
MLEFLAAKMGFTIFAMEANMPETYLLNEFVQNGSGDPAALLRGTGLWTMDTREIDLIQMRDFTQSGKGYLEVAGFNMLAPDLAPPRPSTANRATPLHG